MIDFDLAYQKFNTFYISKEQINCPLIAHIIKLSKKLKDLDNSKIFSSIIVSIGYGKRILINNNNTDFLKFNKNSLLEIVDYDPIKKNLLVIGPGIPFIDTPIHWMIHHARKDINAIVQINNENLSKKFTNKYPKIEKDKNSDIIDLAKEILKKIKINNKIILKNKDVLFFGSNIHEIENNITKLCGKENEN